MRDDEVDYSDDDSGDSGDSSDSSGEVAPNAKGVDSRKGTANELHERDGEARTDGEAR